jgi:hypothetical protein
MSSKRFLGLFATASIVAVLGMFSLAYAELQQNEQYQPGKNTKVDKRLALDLACYCSCDCTQSGQRTTKVRIKCDSDAGTDQCPAINGAKCSAPDSGGNILFGTLRDCSRVYFPEDISG